MARASRSRRTGSSPTPMSSRQAQEGKSVAVGVVPSEGARPSRPDRRGRSGPRPRLARDRARAASRRSRSISARSTTARRSRRSGYPGNVDLATARSARRLYHAAAADPLGRHLLQRPADQRHHHPAPHRQHRPRPFGRAVARPVRPRARRQHADHPQPGRRRALRLRRRQSRAHRLPPARRASPSSRSPPNASRCPTGCARTRSAPPPRSAPARPPPRPRPRRRATRASAASPRSRRCARTGSRSRSCCSSSPCSPSAAAASLLVKDRPKPAMDPGRRRRRPAARRDRRLPLAAEPAPTPKRPAESAAQAPAAAPTASPAAISAASCPSAAGSPSPPTSEVPLDWTANGCVNGRTQYAQNGDGLDPDPRPRPTSRRCRCSNSGPATANMSSPATCSTAAAMDAGPRAAARRRRQGLHRRRRGAHHPRRPAARDRRDAAAAAQRAAGLCLREPAGRRRPRAEPARAVAEPRAARLMMAALWGAISMIRKLLLAARVARADGRAAPSGTRRRRPISSSTARAAEQDARDFAAKLERFHFVLRRYHDRSASRPHDAELARLPARRTSSGRAHRSAAGSVAGYYVSGRARA